MAELSKMRADKKAWTEWRPETAAGLPYGVPDNLELVGGVGKKTKDALAKEGITSLTTLSMLPDDDIDALEARTGIMKGRIRREEWVEQARELLEGLPPRARSDLPLWTRLQQQAARTDDLTEAVAVAPLMDIPEETPETPVDDTTEPAYAADPAPPVMAAYTAPPPSGDHIRIGILTAILTAIAVMFFLGWLFGRDERAAAQAGAVCPPGYYPVMNGASE